MPKFGPLELGLSLAIVLALGVYFLPTIIASYRHKNDKLPIFLLNLFGGWTILGWIIALIWGARNDTQRVPNKTQEEKQFTPLISNQARKEAEEAKIINEFLGKKETVLAVKEAAMLKKEAEEAKIINEFLVKKEAELAAKEAALVKREAEIVIREEAATQIIEEAIAKNKAELAAEEKRKQEEELKDKKPFNIKDTLNKKIW